MVRSERERPRVVRTFRARCTHAGQMIGHQRATVRTAHEAVTDTPDFSPRRRRKDVANARREHFVMLQPNPAAAPELRVIRNCVKEIKATVLR